MVAGSVAGAGGVRPGNAGAGSVVVGVRPGSGGMAGAAGVGPSINGFLAGVGMAGAAVVVVEPQQVAVTPSQQP